MSSGGRPTAVRLGAPAPGADALARTTEGETTSSCVVCSHDYARIGQGGDAKDHRPIL
jgi:hypothetical protein